MTGESNRYAEAEQLLVASEAKLAEVTGDATFGTVDALQRRLLVAGLGGGTLGGRWRELESRLEDTRGVGEL